MKSLRSIVFSPIGKRVIVLGILFELGMAIASVGDVPAVEWMRGVGFAELKLRFEPLTWWKLGWGYGRLGVWAAVSVALALVGLLKKDGAARRRAVLIGLLPLAAAVMAGLADEALKPFLCRMRPEHAVAPAVYKFVNFRQNFPNGSGLGMPSSHAAVAMAGACGLAWWLRGALRRGRRGAGLGWGVRILCGVVTLGLVGMAVVTCVSRVAGGAHYPSDVYVGAWVGYACWLGSKRLMSGTEGKGNPPQPLPQGGALNGERRRSVVSP